MLPYSMLPTLVLCATVMFDSPSHAFQSFTRSTYCAFTPSQSQTSEIRPIRNRAMALEANSRDGEIDDEGEELDGLITNEDFLRESLKDPLSATVRRKKKNGSRYRVLDNRDNLPFLVTVTTPDPYTNNEEMKKQARKNTKLQQQRDKASKKNKSKKNKTINGKTRRNLVGMDGKDSIASSIFTRTDDGNLHKVLGEFALDKSTTSGDIIQVGEDVEYKVQKARCQYKYAGGQKFVMTRKILEVKEVKRLLVEEEVKQLFEMDGSEKPEEPPMLE